MSAPDSYLVERYLEEIARTYDIPWRSNIIEHEEDETIEEDDDSDEGGGQKEVRMSKTSLSFCLLHI